jgi:hypothetical protein
MFLASMMKTYCEVAIVHRKILVHPTTVGLSWNKPAGRFSIVRCGAFRTDMPIRWAILYDAYQRTPARCPPPTPSRPSCAKPASSSIAWTKTPAISRSWRQMAGTCSGNQRHQCVDEHPAVRGSGLFQGAGGEDRRFPRVRARRAETRGEAGAGDPGRLNRRAMTGHRPPVRHHGRQAAQRFDLCRLLRLLQPVAASTQRMEAASSIRPGSWTGMPSTPVPVTGLIGQDCGCGPATSPVSRA